MKKQRRIFSFVLAALLVFAFAGMSAAEVVEIGSAEELVAFGERVKAGETTLGAKLTMNIDLTGVTWEPIGKYILPESGDDEVIETTAEPMPTDNSYNGVFDGNGKTITGLKLTSADAVLFVDTYEYEEGYIETDYYLVAGFFGVLSQDAEVRNLIIASPDIDLSDMQIGDYSSASQLYYDGSMAGAIAGYSAGKIENCGVQGGTLLGDEVGGVVGHNDEDGTVTGCTVSDIETISGYDDAGGVVGENNGVVSNCTASGIGTISSGNGDIGGDAGGIVGYNNRGVATNCTASGIEKISAGNEAGGVVGHNNGEESTITYCSASNIGTILGFDDAGGVAGENEGTIKNCTASGIGTILSSDGYTEGDAGGIVGYNDEGIIANCTASDIGTISGGEAGGVTGENDDTITNCTVSNIGTISGMYVGGVVGHNAGYEGYDAIITNCAAIGIGKIESMYPDDSEYTYTMETCNSGGGGVVGYNEYGTIKNCLLLAGDAPTVLFADEFAGGVLGYLYGGAENLEQVQNCLYPSNLIFENDKEEKPIGNIDLEDMAEANLVESYDVTADAGSLPAIIAMIEQGIAVTVEKGKTYELDITTLPGTQGIEDMTFTWATEDESIVTISGNGMIVTLTGVELGAANVTCTIEGGLEAELTCAVTVVEATSGGGGSSSNCGTLPGVFALFALAALPFIRKQK